MDIAAPQMVFLVLGVAGVLIVLLTRIRLRRPRSHSGRVDLALWIVDLHTIFGLGGHALWFPWLLGIGPDWLKWPAQVLVWLTVLVSMALIGRWSTKGGRHRAAAPEDDWTNSPFLSKLAHYAFALGVLASTICLLTGVLER